MAALFFALAALVLCALGASKRRRDLSEAGRRATVAAFVFTALAGISLWSALLSNDFSFAYVANYTSRSLSGVYTFTALWGGMEGSLLFWAMFLTAFSAVALTKAARSDAVLASWAGAVLAGVTLFFLSLLAWPADPFARVAPIPPDGTGLNPLLQSPGMVVHPPLLYAGFIGFSIPFAFCVAALISGRLSDDWFASTRRWTLFSWSALTIGIVLGGAWAYTELGWGGYWAWDPVENASFLPWLTATAFLHSVIIQEKRQMLKVWNVSLILLTYLLAIFGTFLTRSGLLTSIHTFAEGPIGKWFLPFMGLLVLGAFGLVAWRLDMLRSENRFDSLLSREAAFLANNVLFVAAAFTVLWGTIYPIIAEAFTGVRVSVGPPFFDSVFVPIGLALLLLAGIGPLISWRRMRPEVFVRMVRAPLLAGTVTVLGLAATGVRSPGALTAFGLCAFTGTALFAEFARGSRLYRRREGLGWIPAAARALGRNRRRYGGYVVHLGVVLIVIGLAGAAFRTERQEVLAPGEVMQVGAFSLRYEGTTQFDTPEKRVTEAEITVLRDGAQVTTLTPQRNFHTAQRQWQSEVAIRTTPVQDLYAVVLHFEQDGSMALRSFVNPLTWWIWAGAAVMLAGMAALLSGASTVASPEHGLLACSRRGGEPSALNPCCPF
jgi:cytochrome c-type biogenesis protein CcmF